MYGISGDLQGREMYHCDCETRSLDRVTQTAYLVCERRECVKYVDV